MLPIVVEGAEELEVGTVKRSSFSMFINNMTNGVDATGRRTNMKDWCFEFVNQ